MQFHGGKDPVMFVSNPPRFNAKDRNGMLDYLKKLHDIQYEKMKDAEIRSRISSPVSDRSTLMMLAPNQLAAGLTNGQ